MRNIITKILVAALLMFPAWAQAVSVIATDIVEGNGYERVIIVTSQKVKYSHFVLDNPERLVIDLPMASVKPKNPMPPTYKGKLIKNIRFGRFNEITTRVVVDLARKVGAQSVSFDRTRSGNYSLILELRPTSRAATGEESSASKDIDTRKIVDTLSESPYTPAPKPQLPMIAIDAGHGGVDPGATGSRGQLEKHVTLAYAKALKKALVKSGRYRVVLTRENDKFILLRDRVKKAREAGADMFISLHADSAPEDYARGLSVYTLSETASDKEAEMLAAKENKVDILSGIDLSHESEDVAGILIDLAQRETKNKSSHLAQSLISRLKPHVKLLQNTHRFAGFAVLKAPDVPSVLIELGFLTNKEDQKLLRSDSHKEKVVKGLVAGIDHYFKTRGK